jgi:hypothetical protein
VFDVDAVGGAVEVAIRFLYVESAISSSAFFRSRLATDTLAWKDGSGRRGPWGTFTP